MLEPLFEITVPDVGVESLFELLDIGLVDHPLLLVLEVVLSSFVLSSPLPLPFLIILAFRLVSAWLLFL